MCSAPGSVHKYKGNRNDGDAGLATPIAKRPRGPNRFLPPWAFSGLANGGKLW